MRLAHLNAVRYGRFEGRSVDFPNPCDGEPDLHVVVGANENGKTTLKNALMDVLFGVRNNSPYAFRWSKAQLAIEAVLEAGGRRLQVERAGNRRALMPKEAAEAVAVHLDGVDRAIFARTNAFSHDEMRSHANDLLESKGDIADLLMRDAGGLADVIAHLAELREQSKTLFMRKGNNKSRFRSLDRELKAANSAYEAALLSQTAHDDLRNAHDRARAASEAAEAALATAKARADTLDRLARAAPILKAIDEAEAARTDAPRLSPDLAGRVGKARASLLTFVERRDNADRRIEALEEQIKAADADPDALAKADAIQDLARRTAALGALKAQRANVLTRIEGLRADAMRLARDLGLEASDPETLLSLVPPAVDRDEAKALADQEERLVAAVEEGAQRLSKLNAPPPPAADEETAARLDRLLSRIAQMGDIKTEWNRLRREVDDAASALAVAEDATAADAPSAAPPPLEDGEAAQALIAKAERAAEDAANALEKADRALLDARANADNPAGAVPSEADLAAARQAREAQWATIKAGGDFQAAAPTFEAAVAHADDVADTRFQNVEKIVEAQERARDVRVCEARRQKAEDAARKAAAALKTAREAWAARLSEAGLTRVPADYRAYLARREALLAARKEAERAAAALATLRQRLVAARKACVPFVGEPGAVAEASLAGELAAAMEQMAVAKTQVDDAVLNARVAIQTYEAAQAERPALEEQHRAAEAALAAWRARWSKACAKAGIPPEATPARRTAFFDGYRAIAQKLDEADRDMAERVRAVDRQEKDLAADAAALAEALDAPVSDDLERMAEAFSTRLQKAKQTAQVIQDREEDRKDALLVRDKTEQQIADLRAELAADFADAGLSKDAPLDDLAAAALASDDARARDADVAEGTRRLDELGLTLEGAREGLAAASPQEREGERAHLAATMESLEADRSRLGQEVGRADADLANAERTSLAGTAAENAFAAAALTAAMADIVAQAVRRRLEIAVLSTAGETFAQEQRSPILRRATDLFATLTGGAYDHLTVDESEGRGVLLAHRVHDDASVPVDGLSDGTRDQLIIAVRVAAAQGSPLPFIADDLFVNADDGRAANGFKVLAELARTTQVIYLTHHDHLVPVARGVVGADLSVVHLSP
ncbi:MAG: AAA family ATPase [Devosia sp.]